MDDGQPMPKSAISEELSGSGSVKHKSECHSPAHIKGPRLDSLIHRVGPPYQLQPRLKCFGVVLEYFYSRHNFTSVAAFIGEIKCFKLSFCSSLQKHKNATEKL